MMSYRQQLLGSLLYFGTALSSSACAAVDAAQQTPAMTAYRITGEGAPVVLVHGALSDARAWDPVIDALGDTPGYQFITYHQRYYGPREQPVGKPDDFNRDTHINDLIQLAEAQTSPVTLVTWSYGGDIGLHAMQQRPDLFRAAVHYEPVSFPLLQTVPGGDRAWQAKLRQVMGLASGIARSGDLQGASLRFIEGVFQMSEGTAKDELAPWPQMWRENSGTIPAYASMPAKPLVCAELGHIRSPTLIVQGTESAVDYAMMSDKITRCLGNASTVSVAGHNHSMPMRDPKRFATVVSGYLQVLDGGE